MLNRFPTAAVRLKRARRDQFERDHMAGVGYRSEFERGARRIRALLRSDRRNGIHHSGNVNPSKSSNARNAVAARLRADRGAK